MSIDAQIPQHLFRLMIEQNSVGILLTDKNGTIVYANPRQLDAAGYTLDELLGQNPRIFNAGETPLEVFQTLWSTILAGRIWHGELTNRRKNGEVCRELVRISPIRNSDGEITHFFAIKEENLYGNIVPMLAGRLAIVDPLTGLPNRAMLLERIESALRDANAPGTNAPFALMCIDLDHFRTINDVAGHLAADHLLTQIAKRLIEAVRKSDMVARTGGNEFFIFLPATADESLLQELGQRLLTAIAAPGNLNERSIAVTASIGIARFPLDGGDAEGMMQHAFNAMSAVKNLGGDRFQFYEPPADIEASQLGDLTAALRDVVQRNELRLHYQPKVDIKSGRMVGLEALVRWQHPEQGLISPGRFIPIAEETGLIVNLSQWVIRAVLEELKRWQAAELQVLPVGVNLSLSHFRGGDLPAFIGRALAETGVDPRLLELEISESTLMRDPTQAFVMVDHIREMGVRLALDDFGTGLSSLSYLSRLSVDTLKIDQTFIHDITTNPVNASIVSAMIAMAHKLGKRAIAVGVETEGQALQLRRYDCDELQGFFFSKPITSDEIATLLGAGRELHLSSAEAQAAPQTLLLVDDEPNILNALKRLLRREGYTVLTAASGSEALEILATHRVQVIVSDHRMPEMTGVELLSRARDLYPSTRRIILSGYSDIGTLTDAINRGAVWKFISKPWEDDSLKTEIRHAFDLHD